MDLQSHVLLPVERGARWKKGQGHGGEATAGGHGACGLALEVLADPAALIRG